MSSHFLSAISHPQPATHLVIVKESQPLGGGDVFDDQDRSLIRMVLSSARRRWIQWMVAFQQSWGATEFPAVWAKQSSVLTDIYQDLSSMDWFVGENLQVLAP